MTNIKIAHGNGEFISRDVPTADEDITTWMDITETFFTALLGFGFVLPDTPEHLVDALYAMKKKETK